MRHRTSPVYFTTWNKNKKTRVTFGNCCYELFGLSLEPCPKLPELSVTSRHQINSNVLSVWSASTGKCTKSEVSHCITKSPHASSFKGGPEKKHWFQMVGETFKHSAFCYLPAAAKFWKCLSLLRTVLFGRCSKHAEHGGKAAHARHVSRLSATGVSTLLSLSQ